MKEDGRWKDDRCDVFIQVEVVYTVHVYTHDMYIKNIHTLYT